VVACGAGTDHLAPARRHVDDVIRAYEEQVGRDRGARRPHHPDGEPRAGRGRRSPDDYARLRPHPVAGAQPVIIHWLGEMFDPALAGYWGSADHDGGDGCLPRRHRRHAAKVDGVKISLLDKDKEIAMRRRLPRACACTPATTSTTPN
jgi:hypothetical protein